MLFLYPYHNYFPPKCIYFPNFSQWEKFEDNSVNPVVTLCKKTKVMDIHTYYRLYPELRKRHWQRCYAATELLRIFVARANTEPSKIGGIDFPAGSLIILPSDLYESIGMHPLVYDDAMRRLIDEGDITVTEYRYNRIITLTHYPSDEVEPQSITRAPSEHSPFSTNQLPSNDVGAQYIAPAQPALTENDAPQSNPAQPAHSKKNTPDSHPKNHTAASPRPAHLKTFTPLPHAPPTVPL